VHWAWFARAFLVRMGMGLGFWETNNRLPAISKTTAYQIHDSILKATIAWCLMLCWVARWDISAYGRSLGGYVCSRVFLRRYSCVLGGGGVYPGAAGTSRHIFQEAGSLSRDGERDHSGGGTSALEKHIVEVVIVARGRTIDDLQLGIVRYGGKREASTR
jgi:hypothetical protein